MTVYLLHFQSKLSHAQHYIGSAKDVQKRLAVHKNGKGARILQVLVELGETFSLVRTWNGGRKLEYLLKSRKEAPKLCPVCSPLDWHKRANYHHILDQP
jgi:predicted GIY-YIG superfamily endonuclease